MITFDKLILLTGNRYVIRTDNIDDLNRLFVGLTDINSMMILVLNHGTDVHCIDLGKLLLNNSSMLAGNIIELITQLTPAMLYTFKTPMFQQSRFIRSFMSHDLPGEVIISPYNIEINETTNSIYDPSYRDVVISCEDYDLNKVIPVLNGKLRLCGWNNKKINLKERVDLVPSVEEAVFLSFGDTEINLKALSNVALNNWEIGSDVAIILVLCGSLFYDESMIFRIDSQNRLLLNTHFIVDEFKDRGYDTIESIIADPDSFIIEVRTNRLLIRDVNLLPIHGESSLLEFKCFESRIHDHHVDYIGIDKVDHTVRGITVADEKYVNVAMNSQPYEHHIYADSGSGQLRLIQLSVC